VGIAWENDTFSDHPSPTPSPKRLGEVQRFALKVIANRAIDVQEPAKLPQGRVITPH